MRERRQLDFIIAGQSCPLRIDTGYRMLVRNKKGRSKFYYEFMVRKVPASGVPLAASTICSAIDLVLE